MILDMNDCRQWDGVVENRGTGFAPRVLDTLYSTSVCLSLRASSLILKCVETYYNPMCKKAGALCVIYKIVQALYISCRTRKEIKLFLLLTFKFSFFVFINLYLIRIKTHRD